MSKATIFPKYEIAKGNEVWQKNLELIKLSASKVRSSLGPKGSFKMVVYNRGPEQVIKVTKDPVPILNEISIQSPMATVALEAVKLQREETGDGAISFLILLEGLLKGAEEMKAMKIHPNTIIRGYLEATKRALNGIDALSSEIGEESYDMFLEAVDCGRDFLTDDLRRSVIEACRSAVVAGRLEKEKVRILKKPGGCMSDSYLIHGITIKKERAHPNMPAYMEGLRVAVLSTKFGVNRLEILMKGEGRFPMKLKIDDPGRMSEFAAARHELIRAQLEKLESLNVNLLVCEQLIDDKIKGELARAGIFALERVDRVDSRELACATGASVVGDINDMSPSDVGRAECLEVGKIGLESTVTVSGCGGTTLVLRGNTSQALEELESTVKRCVTVMKLAMAGGHAVPAGGATELCLARDLRKYSLGFPGKEQLAIQYFASALQDVPWCLAENFGLDPSTAIGQLAKHLEAHGNKGGYGICEDGCAEIGYLDIAEAKSAAVRRAYETARFLLKIDMVWHHKEIAKFHKK